MHDEPAQLFAKNELEQRYALATADEPNDEPVQHAAADEPFAAGELPINPSVTGKIKVDQLRHQEDRCAMHKVTTGVELHSAENKK